MKTCGSLPDDAPTHDDGVDDGNGEDEGFLGSDDEVVVSINNAMGSNISIRDPDHCRHLLFEGYTYRLYLENYSHQSGRRKGLGGVCKRKPSELFPLPVR